MASKRFLIVPDDSSAASMPLPGATMARATLLSSLRFIASLRGTGFWGPKPRLLTRFPWAQVKSQPALARENRRFSGKRKRMFVAGLAPGVPLARRFRSSCPGRAGDPVPGGISAQALLSLEYRIVRSSRTMTAERVETAVSLSPLGIELA